MMQINYDLYQLSNQNKSKCDMFQILLQKLRNLSKNQIYINKSLHIFRVPSKSQDTRKMEQIQRKQIFYFSLENQTVVKYCFINIETIQTATFTEKCAKYVITKWEMLLRFQKNM